MPRSIDPALVTRSTGSVDGLLELLFDGLDWPRPAHLAIQDVPLIDLRPADLHLREDALARLSLVQQLPPLTAQQPFGVFILTFEGDRLPIGAIRRVVDGVVRRKRSRRTGSMAVWDLDDLVFFCRTGDGGGSIHVVAFRDQDGKRALRAISWSSDMSPQKLELLSKETLTALLWPLDGGHNLEAWRAAWRDGFQTAYRQGVRTAEKLAEIMAITAREVRDGIQELIQLETDDGPLRRIFAQVRDNLREDLDESTFADMYAQTMVYGLLTARITHPEDFSGATTTLSFENPFLDALYTTFRGDEADTVDIDEFGMLDLADLLARTDVDAILAEFGAKDPRNDPVIYFYEEFLEQYDPEKRRELGTYYTPVPIVRWIVDAVDYVLKSQLQLPDGIRDATTWERYSTRTGIPIPETASPDTPVIRAVDPATGTGTFVLEWLRKSVGDSRGPKRVEAMRGALNRIDAFEIDLPGYTVAHLKTSLELPEELRATTSPGIVLTDTLAGRRELILRENDAIANEGARAEQLKFDSCHNIVIGNPPYRVLAQSSGGGMITEMQAGRRLFDDFYEVAAANTSSSHLVHLYNLYICFIRWSTWKALEQVPSGPAVIGLITPSSWLTGPGFMGVRAHLREHADDIYIVDLGGGSRGATADPNVFPIRTPVAISLIVRRKESNRTTPALVHYTRLFGTRDEKLNQLLERPFATINWTTAPSGWLERMVPQSGSADWLDFPSLGDMFPWQNPGVKFNRTWPIAPDQKTLHARWKLFVSTDDLDERAALLGSADGRQNLSASSGSLPRLADEPVGAEPQSIIRYAYRSFDRQWIFDDQRLASRDRPPLWLSQGASQIFMTVKMTSAISTGPAAVASSAIPDLDSFRGAEGGKDVIPLFRDVDGTPNADTRLLAAVDQVLRGSDSGAVKVTAIRLFAYAYGVLSGSDYSSRYSEELKTPGPRVPLTANPLYFDRMVKHGERLIWLDTFADRFCEYFGNEIVVDADISWHPVPTRGPNSNRDTRYDAATKSLTVGDGLLRGVSPEVAAFEVSGMNVLRKWLGYRTLNGAGRAASSSNALDQIRSDRWEPEWSEELRLVVSVLDEHCRMQKAGALLLDEILSDELIAANQLPAVDSDLKAAPRPRERIGGLFDLAAESPG